MGTVATTKDGSNSAVVTGEFFKTDVEMSYDSVWKVNRSYDTVYQKKSKNTVGQPGKIR